VISGAVRGVGFLKSRIAEMGGVAIFVSASINLRERKLKATAFCSVRAGIPFTRIQSCRVQQ